MSALLEAQCSKWERALVLFVDGELDPGAVLDVEQHTRTCGGCRERVLLLRATKNSLRRTAKERLPEGLRDRLSTAMGEASFEEHTHVSWRVLVPFAAAAAAVFVWRGHTSGSSVSGAVQAGLAGDDVLSEFVSLHSQEFPLAERDARALGSYEKHVGVPIRPAGFERSGATFVASGLVPLKPRQNAALLRFTWGGREAPVPVSVLVFNAREVQVRGTGFSPRPVGTAAVQVGKRDGYSVALTEREGVGCAVAGALDSEQSATLAAMGCGE